MPTSRSKSVPRSEYPRPQLMRQDWLCLNGTWEFAFDDANRGMEKQWYAGKPLSRSITVPFAYQTELSGINDKGIHEVVWYARTFTVPAAWKDTTILLHFGAVDYRSTVWVNGQEVGHNQGGHVSFSFDITPYLVKGENRLTVRVEDRQDPYQPRGKQAASGVPGEVDYYCTTGIWQTVWLEPVPKLRIENLRITPLFKQKALEILVYLHAPSADWRLEVEVSEGETVVARRVQETTNATSQVVVPIKNPKYWTPEDPHLYDLRIALYQGDQLIDEVESYAALRGVQIRNSAFYLNGQPRFLAMALDQGYWPKGGMTAPTDNDLRKDVELAKSYGFNGVRKHQKVEDPRWLYWCDQLGLMVWSEMANARVWSPAAEEALLAEWERAVRRDYSHPSIVAWVPMNESWGVPGLHESHPGQYAFLERIVARTRQLDQFRPVIDNDGWEHTDITDICAIHDYAPTGAELKKRFEEMLAGGPVLKSVWTGYSLFAGASQYHNQPIMLTEVGGFLSTPDDVPEEKRDVLYKHYGSLKSDAELLARYTDLMEGMASLPFVAGFCYTQLIDVEHERNGLLTYDRKPKCSPKKIAALHRRLFRRL